MPRVRNSAPGVTPRAPDAAAVSLLARGATEAEKFRHYAAIVAANGGKVNPAGLATVLGVRGLNADGARHATRATRAYDDFIVVLTSDGHVNEFSGATHPGNAWSPKARDVDGDTKGDVGTIRPGNFLAEPHGPQFGGPSFSLRTADGNPRLPGWRDTDQDGRVSERERTASVRRADSLTEVLFHPDSAFSVGCQTLAPNDWERFVEAVGGPAAHFTYTLVDG